MTTIKQLIKNANRERVRYNGEYVQLVETPEGYEYLKGKNPKGVAVLVYRTGDWVDEKPFLAVFEPVPAHGDKQNKLHALTGTIEGESAKTTAVREVAEEAGYVIAADELIPLGGTIKPAKNTDWELTPFAVHITPDHKKVSAKGDGSAEEENATTRWVTKERALKSQDAVLHTLIARFEEHEAKTAEVKMNITAWLRNLYERRYPLEDRARMFLVEKQMPELIAKTGSGNQSPSPESVYAAHLQKIAFQLFAPTREGYDQSYRRSSIVVDRPEGRIQDAFLGNPVPDIARTYHWGRKKTDEQLRKTIGRQLQKGDTAQPYALMRLLSQSKSLPESSAGEFVDLSRDIERRLTPIQKEVDKVERNKLVLGLGSLGLGGGLWGLTRVMNNSEDEVQAFTDFIRQRHPSVENVTTDIHHNPLSSFYNPKAKHVSTGNILGIAGHEFGHARQDARWFRNSPNLKRLWQLGYMDAGHIPVAGQLLGPLRHMPLLSLAALPVVSDRAMNALKGDDPESLRYKALNKIQENPHLAIGAFTLPKLIEEAGATTKGTADLFHFFRSMGKSRGKALAGAAKSLVHTVPAFGTYLLGAAIPTALAYGAKEVREKRRAVEPFMERIKDIAYQEEPVHA